MIGGWALAGMAAAGCQAPHDSIDAILKRHSAALARLPAEDRRRFFPVPEAAPTSEPGPPVVPEVLYLPDAREIALRANPDVHAAQARLEASLARIGEARAAYYPVLSLIHNSTRTFQTPATRNPLIRPFPTQIPQVFSADQGIDVGSLFSLLGSQLFGTPSYGGETNSFSHHSSLMSVTWTLFDGFAREARLLANKHNYRATAMAMADVERLVVQAVDTAYLQILLGREQLRIALADEQFSREQLAQAERNRDLGKATRADVLNFDVRVRTAQANVTIARGVLNTARVVLAELMGLPNAELPEEVGLPPLEEETEENLTPPDEGEWVERGLRNRPDLAQRRHALDSAAENVGVAKAQFSPAVTLSGSYGFENRGNMGYSDSDQSSAVGIEMNWQLFTGGFRTSQLRRSEAERREALANLERIGLAVASEVRQASVTLINAQEQVKLQRVNLDSARENREIIRAQYAAGKESLVRLNEAQRDFVQTDADLAAARIRLRQAWTDLYAAAAAYPEILRRRQEDGLLPEPLPGVAVTSEPEPSPGEGTRSDTESKPRGEEDQEQVTISEGPASNPPDVP